jgi:OOP family OmpA-OmpF porin
VKLKSALIGASCFAMPFMASSIAHAQPVTGVYVAGGVGYNIELKQNLKDGVVGTTPIPGNANVASQDGFMGEGSVGYGFGNGFRVELEGDYYSNIFSKNPNTNAIPAASGRSTKYGAMVNGLYDESKASFAGQAIVGVAFPIATVPGLSFSGEYRFMALVSARKYHGTYNGIDSSFKTQDDYNNSFLLGARYQLYTPPPPPPAPTPAPMAAPAPAPAKTYLVFFDWDKYNLTPRALDIIAQAASDSKTQSTTTIAVNGYTDTSGTPAYNQGLSVRRAKAVEAQLVTDGVPASEITAQGFGDTDLLVPTGPGVREPQNRRVQIVLQ